MKEKIKEIMIRVCKLGITTLITAGILHVLLITVVHYLMVNGWITK